MRAAHAIITLTPGRSSPVGLRRSRDWLLSFGAGLVAGGAGLVLVRALRDRPSLDGRLIRALVRDAPVSPTVVVPGLLGSSLFRPDGSRVWLDLGNTVGWHDLSLPLAIPPMGAGDDLVPGPVVGHRVVLPRLFGFTEYADLFDLLERAGFRSLEEEENASLGYLVASYDWRLDLLASVRRLHGVLERLAQMRGSETRASVLCHSMGGLIARYYLRYGTAEPGGPVTWAGARHIRRLLLVSPPNGGSVGSLGAILRGDRVGLSYGTLAASVVERMPAIYHLLPPRETTPLVNEKGKPLDADLLDIGTWDRLGWGPFAPRARRPADRASAAGLAERRAFLEAVLARARAIHEALAQLPATPCPVSVTLLGGDCVPTLARAVVSGRRGSLPRFEPETSAQADALLEAGDARVTRASALAAHLPGARTNPFGCGLAEVDRVFFGAADHHGIYAEPTFQSLLLRRLLDRD